MCLGGVCMCVYVCVCLTLCDPIDYSPPDSSVHRVLQAGMLEWVAISYSGDLPNPGVEPASLCLLHGQAGSVPGRPSYWYPGWQVCKFQLQAQIYNTEPILKYRPRDSNVLS